MIEVKKIKKDIVLIEDTNAEMISFIQDEIIIFQSGATGIVMEADHNKAIVGVLNVSMSTQIKMGMSVTRTQEAFAIKVSKEFLGHVVDFMGNIIQSMDEGIRTKHVPKSSADFRVDINKVVLIERDPVSEPLESGIMGIDIFIPFGKGQRELIAGDKNTGKTTLALSFFKANKDKDNLVFIYNGIGKTKTEIKKVIEFLQENDLVSKTIIVVAFIGDSEVGQYYSPYLATTIAEYFSKEWDKDVLIIYDDLIKQAEAYRSISLQLSITPGREAFPGDIFYTHSRLLERSGNFRNGASISSLSICETIDGDIAAYIPTNIISITDGQIVTDNTKFNLNIYPAVDYGASVSRVGRAAQTLLTRHAQDYINVILANYESIDEEFIYKSSSSGNTLSQARMGYVLSSIITQPIGSVYTDIEQWVLSVLIKNNSIKVIKTRKTINNLVNYILKEIKENEKFVNVLDIFKEDSQENIDLDLLSKIISIELEPYIAAFLRREYKTDIINYQKIVEGYQGYNFIQNTDEDKWWDELLRSKKGGQ